MRTQGLGGSSAFVFPSEDVQDWSPVIPCLFGPLVGPQRRRMGGRRLASDAPLQARLASDETLQATRLAALFWVTCVIRLLFGSCRCKGKRQQACVPEGRRSQNLKLAASSFGTPSALLSTCVGVAILLAHLARVLSMGLLSPEKNHIIIFGGPLFQ